MQGAKQLELADQEAAKMLVSMGKSGRSSNIEQMERQVQSHQSSAKAYKWSIEHIIPNAVYILSTSDMETLGLRFAGY